MPYISTGLLKYLSFGICLTSTFLFCSCSKETEVIEEALAFSEQKYSMEITGNWNATDFTIPANAHFTNFVGMVHAKDSFMWKPNSLATIGLERVAENGYNTTMLMEMNEIITLGKGKSTFNFLPPAITGVKTDTVIVNTNYPCIGFASMIAPTPDWFIGLGSFNCITNNKWVDDITIPLLVYDAGTEEGNVLAMANPATLPQQNIGLLTGINGSALSNGNNTLKPIATVRFRRIIN
jgi:hypothetical protein